MKKIIFYSEESLFSGNVKCGIAEVVDSLGNALAKDYEVSIVCKSGNLSMANNLAELKQIKQGVNFCRFLQVDYYMIDTDYWPEEAIDIINRIKPDIFHNFENPNVASRLLQAPQKSIYTFDDLEYIKDKLDFLYNYNYITTFSNEFYKVVLESNTDAAKFLQHLPFKKVRIGISSDIIGPEEGLLLPMMYNSINQNGKEQAKLELCKKYGLSIDKPIFLYMSRISYIKGAELVLSMIPIINKLNGQVIVIGKGENEYEERLQHCVEAGQIIFINKKFTPFHMPTFMAGADFYLQPSVMESGGLMPLSASRYGAIPIVTLNGGLADNFNKENAIIILNDNLDEAIAQAFKIYQKKDFLYEKRKICMTQDFSWDTRKKDFIELYEE